MKFAITILLVSLSLITTAQKTQQLRGTIVDQVLQKPLAGAAVNIPILNRSVLTDAEGNFRFNDVSVGTYRLTVTNAGFKELAIENIAVNSGKETILTLPMEMEIRVESEVIIKANSKKNKPLNDMSMVSARAFSVEETQRYAASVNDPLRMAQSFPGVLSPDDGNNLIIIRGNSPTGLLWKMEGMDIPNPNHFSSVGASGGGISILSSQLLSNSDFVTGAFAAEYGNAIGGVFDLHLRKGNNEKREYTLQAGVLGLNAAVEGPFSKKYKGSYLVNYRYSTLNLLNRIGVLPDEASTNFQDLSYNISLPTNRLGNFSIFGFNGRSKDQVKAEFDSTKWEERDDRSPSEFIANTYMNGVTHVIHPGKKSTLKSAIGYSRTENTDIENYIDDDLHVQPNGRETYTTKKWMFNSTLNYKVDKRTVFRTGIILNLLNFNFYQLSRELDTDPLQVTIDSRGNTSTQQAFAQLNFKVSDNISVTGGLHYLRLALNKTSALEPRFGAKWNISRAASIGLGFGSHSQLQGLGVYFARIPVSGQPSMLNKNLEFTKSRHYVVSYNQRLSSNLVLKTEAYLQQLSNVPVGERDSSTFSTLNILEEYVTDQLVNKGSGKNYGVEISIERYLKNNFYLTLSNSIYQSKYKALDGIERNTRFNGNYIVTFIAGKDFESFLKTKTFGINIKTIYAGGQRTTPIDMERSRQAGHTVFRRYDAYSLQNEAYFRTDIRISMKWNRKNFTSTLSLDIQNITNRENVYSHYYSAETGKIITTHQTGLIPVLNYKIDF